MIVLVWMYWHFVTGTDVLVYKCIFRKILNELSSDVPAVPKIEEEEKVEEEAPPTSGVATVTAPSSIYQTSSGQYSTSEFIAQIVLTLCGMTCEFKLLPLKWRVLLFISPYLRNSDTLDAAQMFPKFMKLLSVVIASVWEIEDKRSYCFVSVQLQSLRVERYSWPALEERPCKGFRLWLFPAPPHPSLGTLSCSTAPSLETLANSYC